MTKLEFLSLMKFPKEWVELSMYPPALFDLQISTYEPGHENGSAHDRNGAFHWWLRNNPDDEKLKNLLILAAADPDRALGEDILQYIHKSENFNGELKLFEKRLFNKK